MWILKESPLYALIWLFSKYEYTVSFGDLSNVAILSLNLYKIQIVPWLGKKTCFMSVFSYLYRVLGFYFIGECWAVGLMEKRLYLFIFLCLSVPPTRHDVLMMIVHKGGLVSPEINIAQTKTCLNTHSEGCSWISWNTGYPLVSQLQFAPRRVQEKFCFCVNAASELRYWHENAVDFIFRVFIYIRTENLVCSVF